MNIIKEGKYQHYKGDFYEVTGFALHVETREKLVLYKACYETPELYDEYGSEPVFARPYSMFAEMVEVEGQDVPRFKRVE